MEGISIIIPTLNEEKYLPRLLCCLQNQTYKDFQIIVADGGSKDKTLIKARTFQKLFKHFSIIQTKPGIALQRNHGTKEAIFDTLLFIDADITFSKKTLQKVTNKSSKTFFISTALIFPSDGKIFEKIIFGLSYLGVAIYSFFDPIAYGGFLITNRANHEKIGGFIEGALLGEDTDYTKRSVENNAKFKVLWNVPVFHSCRRARIMGLFGLFWFYTRSFLYYKRHGLLYDTKRFSYPYGIYGA